MAGRDRSETVKEKTQKETEDFEELKKRSMRKKDLPEKKRRRARDEDDDYDDDDDYDEYPAERKARHTFRHICELIVIALTYFQRSAIVRFLTVKLSMDVVVEVSARFGAGAGHRLSTFLAAISADPRILALIVTGIILFFNFLTWIFRKLRG